MLQESGGSGTFIHVGKTSAATVKTEQGFLAKVAAKLTIWFNNPTTGYLLKIYEIFV